MLVYLVNESQHIDDTQAFNIAWACNWQARYQFGRHGWRSDVQCSFMPSGAAARIPAGSAILHLLDKSDAPGALGYHDEDGNEVPYARVFVDTTIQDGGEVSETASHELLELALDPNVNLSALDSNGGRLYALEACDACQGNGYDVLEPHGKTSGIQVADFVLPAYFDPNTPARTPTSFRGALKGPFALGPQGYFSYLDLNNVSAGWQQQVGGERKTPVTPDRDDRLGRRQ